MATTSSVQASSRPPIDTMQKQCGRSSGEGCQESWVMLPEDQKGWWRNCATECVRQWMMSAGGSIAKVGSVGFSCRWGGSTTPPTSILAMEGIPESITQRGGSDVWYMEDRLDLVLDSHPQRLRQHKAERVQRETTIRDAHAELAHKQEKFGTEVRSLLEQAVGRANRHLATRPEKCRLGEVSGYLTGPLFVGGSACNPIAYELMRDGQEVGETLIVELTNEGMIEAFLGPFRPTVSEGHTNSFGPRLASRLARQVRCKGRL